MKLKNQNSYRKLPILDGLELLNAKHHIVDFPFHTHSTFNITLVIEQTFSTNIYNRFLQAPVGTIVITNPMEVHATICDATIGSTFFTFYISPDVLTGLNNKKPVFFYDKIVHDASLFEELYILSMHFNNSFEGADVNNSLGFENKLLKALKKLVKLHAANKISENKKNTNFQRFLEEEPYEKFSLESAAHKFGLDKFKFLRLFKHETGLTPNNYIILKRIEKCKHLLQTHDNLLEIAIETGFYDATHLCKYFKKITGITPLAYRNA